jgi:hypothetical protein
LLAALTAAWTVAYVWPGPTDSTAPDAAIGANVVSTITHNNEQCLAMGRLLCH